MSSCLYSGVVAMRDTFIPKYVEYSASYIICVGLLKESGKCNIFQNVNVTEICYSWDLSTYPLYVSVLKALINKNSVFFLQTKMNKTTLSLLFQVSF